MISYWRKFKESYSLLLNFEQNLAIRRKIKGGNDMFLYMVYKDFIGL